MDENYENQEHNNYCKLEKHPVWKHILHALMCLLGAFLAFYFVTDWYFKSMLDPVHQMRRIDKAMERSDRQMEKNFKRAYVKGQQLEDRASRLIRLEETDKGYRVLVDLVPLNDSEKNVDVKTNGNVLTVRAAKISGFGDKKSLVEFTQSYMFDDDVDLNKITKERKGDYYIISIPQD